MIEDTIEGWSDAVLHLLKCYTQRRPEPVFDYSQIRPKNTILQTSGGLAPGPGAAQERFSKITKILQNLSAGN